MTDDVRIATGLRHHRKIKRLKRLLGGDGCWALVCLFLWAGEERWTGDLSGLSDDDLEEEAGWDGTPGALIAALVEVRFLVGERGYRAINDWQEHNPYAASKGNRIARGKKGAKARWEKEKDASSMQQACSEHAPSTNKQCPPAPAPAPTPANSVANATGADAPSDPLWHTGLAFLMRKGIPQPQARKFLGKLKREAGEVDAAALLAQAEAEDITDPVPWLSQAAINARNRRQGRAQPSKTLGAIHQLEAMKHGLAGNRNPDGIPEAPLLGFGPDPGG